MKLLIQFSKLANAYIKEKVDISISTWIYIYIYIYMVDKLPPTMHLYSCTVSAPDSVKVVAVSPFDTDSERRYCQWK